MNETDSDNNFLVADDLDGDFSSLFLDDDEISIHRANKPVSPRQRIEDYLEQRRLREEINELDFDN